MNSKMTTDTQLSTTEPKNKNKNENKLSKQLEQEQIHRNGDHMEGYQMEVGVGRTTLPDAASGSGIHLINLQSYLCLILCCIRLLRLPFKVRYRLGSSNTRNPFSHSSGGWTARCQQGCFLLRPLSLACRWSPSPGVFT